jgi:pyrroloquinoline quinone biosynthesis protein D
VSDFHGVAQRPLRSPGVRVADRGGDAKLVDGSGTPVLALNDTALAIWDLCDGATTVEEMVEAVVTAFAVDLPEATADVEDVIGQLGRMGVLDDSA